ncbi:hypothetical protein FMM56_08460 [Campylobacter sp. LR264d]|uniref:MotA/TolQ/ExbB proton channel family protein n=1 Tax=Campylobacter sp. LR264d TaxID=2593544 RepID=UPI00123C2D0F|nr:MotA/TolQ/ExbB proton channel family protein [Campylobacter sp. LR264d]KAA6229565.1 hypothetical protein FMM56_08460 [Campylobacter sp. LR264d]
MDIKSEEISELILPESREKKGYFVYTKIVFLPSLIFLFVLLGYFNYIPFPIQIHTFVMIAIIYVVSLIFARHNAEYAYNIFEQQKDEFKQALKSHIMKHFLTVGKDTKSNANFDDFAYEYIKVARNEKFAAIAPSVFPMLGILGTFISIAISLPNFTSSDTIALEQEIAQLLSGVATAFYISIYGIFLALWWLFFEKFGTSKLITLLNRQKKSTSGFFWTKEELDQRYLSESLQHFEKIGLIFNQVSNENFFADLDKTIERKFDLFKDMLDKEEKTIILGAEHIKQTMAELGKSQREQRDLNKLYADMLNATSVLSHNLREISTRMSEHYNRLLDISNEKTQHLDKTLLNFDQRVERFQRGFELYERHMLENQEKIFNGFKDTLIEGMHRFKEVYEEEKNIDSNIQMMDNLKQEIKLIDSEASAMISRLEEEKDEKVLEQKMKEAKEVKNSTPDNKNSGE